MIIIIVFIKLEKKLKIYCQNEKKKNFGIYKVSSYMRKPVRKKSIKKTQKNNFEERFSMMVKEYQEAKETLESMEVGSKEYMVQNKLCDKLFSNAERYINKN